MALLANRKWMQDRTFSSQNWILHSSGIDIEYDIPLQAKRRKSQADLASLHLISLTPPRFRHPNFIVNSYAKDKLSPFQFVSVVAE